MNYNFEWDRDKARLNKDKHGVGFEEGATIFRDPRMLSLYDGEHSQNEDRWVTLGISSNGRLLVVCHTFKEDAGTSATIRIISSRKATRTETKSYRTFT